MRGAQMKERKTGGRRRGAVVALTVATLMVLFVVASFAIDLGFVRAVCAEMQNAADAGSLAGASALIDSDGQDADGVLERALDVIERMQKHQGFLALEDQIIEVGTWDFATRKFTAVDPGVRKPFAVRVVGVRNKTPLFFAAVIGKYSTNVRREAVALGSGRCSGIWGLRGVRAVGTVMTDSYNSDEGPYLADTAYENGDICSGRHVLLNGGLEVRGDVMCGFGYQVEVNGASGEITGLTTASTTPLQYSPLEFGDIRTNNDNRMIPARTNNGDDPWGGRAGLNLYLEDNDNIVLPPGRFYFDSITMHSGATITLTGKTEIYVGGNVSAAGAGVISNTTDPQNLDMIVGGTQFSLGGGYEFYGSVVAPYAAVKLYGTADFFGALIGGTVDMLGTFEFHVDESLPEANFFDPPTPSLVR